MNHIASPQAVVRTQKRLFDVGLLGLHFTWNLCLTVLITVLLLQVSELRLELHDLDQCPCGVGLDATLKVLLLG